MTTPAAINWKLCAFDDLSLQELHDLLQLRTEVFVVEQNCVFQDMDGTDAQAFHLLGLQDKRLVAYARCFPAGVKFAEASIGRVITRANVRGTGMGHSLIDKAIESVGVLWGPQAICIGAQARLAKYYSGHGFVDVGRPYVEDGIEHLEMRWQPSKC